MRILLVEDDNMIGQSLRQALTENGELRELLARMRAIIRRFGGHAQSTIGVRGLGWRVSKDPT